MTPKALIALPVHGVGKHPEAVAKTVMWRNLPMKELAVAVSPDCRMELPAGSHKCYLAQ